MPRKNEENNPEEPKKAPVENQRAVDDGLDTLQINDVRPDLWQSDPNYNEKWKSKANPQQMEKEDENSNIINTDTEKKVDEEPIPADEINGVNKMEEVPDSMSLEDAIETKFMLNDISHAYNINGRRFESRADMLRELGKNGTTLYLFTKDMVTGKPSDYPYAVSRSEDGKLSISEMPISIYSPVTETEFIETLNLADILGTEKLNESRKQLTEDMREVNRAITKENEELQKAKQATNQFLTSTDPVLDKETGELIARPSTPTPARVAFSTRAKRFFLGLIPFYKPKFAPTLDENRFQNEMQKYNQDMQKYLNAKKNALKTFKKAENEIKARIERCNVKVDELRENILNIKALQKEKDSKRIMDYHKNPEVTFEGLKDIREHGLNANNIFAEVWQLRGEINGRRYTPEMEDTIARFLVAAYAEGDILGKLDYNKNLARRIAAGKDVKSETAFTELALNTIARNAGMRQEIEGVKKSEAFKKLIANIGSNRIDCKKLSESFSEYAKEFSHARNPETKLLDYRKNMIDSFGKKKFSKDCLEAIAKLNLLDYAIEKLRAGETGRYTKESFSAMVLGDLNMNLSRSLETFGVKDVKHGGKKAGSSLRIFDRNTVKKFYNRAYQMSVETAIKHYDEKEPNVTLTLEQMRNKVEPVATKTYKDLLSQNVTGQAPAEKQKASERNQKITTANQKVQKDDQNLNVPEEDQDESELDTSFML